MNRICKLLALTAVAAMTTTGALAEYVSFSGTVESAEASSVLAEIGGTVDSVEVVAGQHVSKGDILATLRTTKVYAAEAGVVSGIFGEAGDNVDNVSATYGAVLYIEPEADYTVSASTEKSYDAEENKFVHVGEEVYISCYSDGSHTGTGVVTAVSGTDFTVRVESGEFMIGETVSMFRDAEYTSSSRIGRGDIARNNPTAYTGSGSIVSINVENGAEVAKGDLLFETLDGSFDGMYMSGTDIISPIDGTVAETDVTEASSVSKDAVAFKIYPDGMMRIEAEIDEGDLSGIAVGDAVDVELTWNEDEDVVYPGVVSMISAIGTTGSDTVTYTVYVDFTADENVRYGMSAVVSTAGSSEDDDEAASDDSSEMPDGEVPEGDATEGDVND